MSLMPQFKKHYPTYLLGIVVPAIVNFLTIPVFKNVIGKEKFGAYVFYYSILIIINSSFAGGITQSIIRLHVDFENKAAFYSRSIWLTVLVQAILCLPLFFYIQWNQARWIFSILFIIALFAANIYTTLIAITQANQNSRVSALAEAFRTIIFLGLALILLAFQSSLYFLNSIFFALVCSYSMPLLFLFVKNKLDFKELLQFYDFAAIKATGKIMAKYGGFLIIWFFLSYGISFGNRFVLAGFLGKEEIGHYAASFDILNKSIILVISPVLISLFPIVVSAHASGDYLAIKKIINRLTLIEIMVLLVGLPVFWFIGFPILSKILNTPETNQYLWIDVQVLVSTFIWQIAMLQHKYLELEKKTGQMVVFAAAGFIATFLFDMILISNFGVRFASLGFLAGGIIYLSGVMYYNKISVFKARGI